MFDLLAIYEIMLRIRFALNSSESLQLVTLLVEALYLKLGYILNNQHVDDMFIRKFLLDKKQNISFDLSIIEERYRSNNVNFNEPLDIISFLLIMYSIKSNLINKDYNEAFLLVDEAHNYPIGLIEKKKMTRRKMSKLVRNISSTGDGLRDKGTVLLSPEFPRS